MSEPTVNITSAGREIPVSVDVFSDRAEVVDQLFTRATEAMNKVAALKRGMPLDADKMLTLLDASRQLHEATTALHNELAVQSVKTHLVSQAIVSEVSGLSPATLRRRMEKNPVEYIDDGLLSKGRFWAKYTPSVLRKKSATSELTEQASAKAKPASKTKKSPSKDA